MLKLNQFVINNNSGVKFEIINMYQEYDFSDDSEYMVVVLKDSNGALNSIPKEFVEANHSIADTDKEIQELLNEFHNYKKQCKHVESLHRQQIESDVTFDSYNDYNFEYDQLEQWECDLMERAEMLNIELPYEQYC